MKESSAQVQEGQFGTRIRAHLKDVAVGKPIHDHSLTLFPLMGSWDQKQRYALLEEGIAAGTVIVTETSEAGQVPFLLLANGGDLPVLLPEGEILQGEKQNRVINVTILVAAHMQFTVPVSCVEQGRWHRSRAGFRTSSHAPSSVRASKMRSFHMNRACRGEARSDQGEVWREVDCRLQEAQAHSATCSMSDAYEQRREDLDQLRDRVSLPPETRGVVVCRSNRIVGVDLFDSPRTFSKLWNRLADGYLIELLRDAPCDRRIHRSDIARFLNEIPKFARQAHKPLGIGEEFSIEGEQMVGAGVSYQDAICHLCAFTNR